METLDATIILTALPSIAKSLHVDPLQLKLAITTYLLSLGLFIPVSGWMVDRFGARKIFMSAINIFMLGSIVCGLSINLTIMLIGRLVQGMGGAMMMPVATLMVLRSVPKAQLAKVLGFVTIPGIIGPMVGPLLGGLIVTYLDWRIIFFINLPIGVLGLWLASIVLPENEVVKVHSFDWIGFVLFGLSVMSLIVMIESIGTPYMHLNLELVFLVVGLVSCLLYVMHARGSSNPVISLELFSISSFKVVTMSFIMVATAISGVGILNPLFFQLALKYSPILTGLLLFGFACAIVLAKLVNHVAIEKLGMRNWSIINSMLSSVGMLGMLWVNASTSLVWVLSLLMVQGFAASCLFTNLNVVLYIDVPKKILSQATGFGNMVMQISFCLGTALAGVLVDIFRGLNPTLFTIETIAFHQSYLIMVIIVIFGGLILLGLNENQECSQES